MKLKVAHILLLKFFSITRLNNKVPAEPTPGVNQPLFDLTIPQSIVKRTSFLKQTDRREEFFFNLVLN